MADAPTNDASSDHATPGGLEDLMDNLNAELEGQASLAVQDILDAFGSRSFGPLLAAPALVAISPVGAIPGVPAVLAAVVVLVAAQHLIGRNHPWIPRRLRERSVDADAWNAARDRLRPWARRIDRFIKPRLTRLTTGVMDRVISAVAIVLALMMIPLELLPFAVAAPGAALLLFGLALSARDGVLALLGLASAAGSGWLAAVALG